jgi:hypothetical protein
MCSEAIAGNKIGVTTTIAGLFSAHPAAAGENSQQVVTYNGQRLRANRVVIVTAE